MADVEAQETPSTSPKLILLVVVLTFIFGYLSLVPPGADTDTRRFNNYYQSLAQAFAAGRLDLGDAPAELLALKNPYNPLTAGRFTRDPQYKVWDYSLYNNKLYLYFGITPVLIFYLPLTLLSLQDLANDYWALVFVGLGLIFVNLSIVRAIERLKGLGSITLTTSIRLAVVLSTNLVPLLIARGRTYEVALAFGQLFSLLALRMLIGMFSRTDRPGRANSMSLCLIAAGLFAGLAVGCRPHYIIGLGLALLYVVATISGPLFSQARLRFATCLFTPFALVLALLAAYNYLRFDSIFEFGVTWQLGIFDAQNVPTLSLQRVPYNFYFLAFHFPKLISEFPWLVPSFSETIALPHVDIRYIERPAGFLVAFPILWFAILTTWRAMTDVVGRTRRTVNGWRMNWQWLFIIPMLANFVLLTLWVASIDRYSADFLSYAAILAVFAIPSFKSNSPKHSLGLSIAVAIATVGSCAAAWALAYASMSP